MCENLKEIFQHKVQLTMDKAAKDWQKWLEQLSQRKANMDKTRDRNENQKQDHNEKQKKKKIFSRRKDTYQWARNEAIQSSIQPTRL